MVPFESLFFFIDYPMESFLGSKSHFPVAGANVMLPYGVPFDSLSFLYVTPSHFFDLKITTCNRPFFRPRFCILTGDKGGGRGG